MIFLERVHVQLTSVYLLQLCFLLATLMLLKVVFILRVFSFLQPLYFPTIVTSSYSLVPVLAPSFSNNPLLISSPPCFSPPLPHALPHALPSHPFFILFSIYIPAKSNNTSLPPLFIYPTALPIETYSLPALCIHYCLLTCLMDNYRGK